MIKRDHAGALAVLPLLVCAVLLSGCVPYAYERYSLVLTGNWADKCVLTGSFKAEAPKSGNGQFWVRDVCVKYEHTIDDLGVQVDAGVEHTLVFTVTHQNQPLSWRTIASTNPCDVESQYGDTVFRTFLSTLVEQDALDRRHRLEMLESAFQQAQYSGFAFHEAATKRLTRLGATLDDSLEQHNDGGVLKAANRYLQSLRSMRGANGRANDREKAYRSAQRALSDLADVSQGMDYDFSDMQATLDDLSTKHVPARPQSAAGRQDLFHANVGFSPYFWNISQAAPSSRRCPEQFVSNPVMVTLQPYGRDLQITVPVYVKHNGYNWLWDSV